MKWLRLAVFTVLLAMLAMWLLPGFMDARFNQVSGSDIAVSNAAAILHSQTTVVDLHADPLLWRRDLNEEHRHGHIDLPRLRTGHVGLQVFGLVTKSPSGQNFDQNPADSDRLTPLIIVQRRPIAAWTSLLERALDQARDLDVLVQQNADLRWVRSQFELGQMLGARQRGEPAIGAMLGLEGSHALEGNVANLEVLHDAGLRMLGLAHFFDNEFAGSAHGMEKGGLTHRGRKLLEEARRLHMIIDLSHASEKVMDEVLKTTDLPVLFSHTGVAATCPGPRNLSDEQLRKAAARGAIFGIALFPGAVCGDDLASAVRAMRHIRDLVGIQHVALGTDFDGAVMTPIDVAGLPELTQSMLNAGFSPAEIDQALGRNALRFFARHLPAE